MFSMLKKHRQSVLLEYLEYFYSLHSKKNGQYKKISVMVKVLE